jgi:GntR family transcriptional repressor for pyruvate dehydrogenase complex
MEDLLRQGLDFVDPDVRFHELIFIAAHNPVLSKILSALRELLLDSRRFTNRIPGGPEKAVHFHHLIASAIKERNPEGARAMMYQHILDMERSIAKSDIEVS